MTTLHNNLYLQRINTTIDYIRTHLDADLSLDTLATIACFSPFHFHRIFKSVTGETLNHFINRVRIERAATLMQSDPSLKALDAALMVGYQSAAGFSRAFKKRFGMSPRQWDRKVPLQDRKIGQVFDTLPTYTISELADIAGEQEFQVHIMERPVQTLAYIRVQDSYSNFDAIIDAYHHLLGWYQNQGGDLAQATLYGMSQDDPDITPLAKCRFDWALSVPETWGHYQSDTISFRQMPAHEVVAIHMHGNIAEEHFILRYLWRYWLVRSPYQPANLPAMEMYCQLPHLSNWQRYDMYCAIPITKL